MLFSTQFGVIVANFIISSFVVKQTSSTALNMENIFQLRRQINQLSGVL